VEIRVGAKATDVTLTCDGQVGCELQADDIVRVEEASQPLFLIKSRQEDYFTILRDKLKWGQR
jgi:NAD+ kinase